MCKLLGVKKYVAADIQFVQIEGAHNSFVWCCALLAVLIVLDGSAAILAMREVTFATGGDFLSWTMPWAKCRIPPQTTNKNCHARAISLCIILNQA